MESSGATTRYLETELLLNKAAKLTGFAISPSGSLWVVGHGGGEKKEKTQSWPQRVWSGEGKKRHRVGHVHRTVTTKACGKREKETKQQRCLLQGLAMEVYFLKERQISKS